MCERTPGADIDEKLANTPKAELLQYYIDSIFDDGAIVPALDLIAKREKRRRDLNDDPVRTKRLGMKYWDAERLLAPKVQALVWSWLKENGVALPSPDALPDFIRWRIEQEMVSHWLEVHGRENVIIDIEEPSGINVETVCDTKRTRASGEPAPEKNEDAGIIRQRGDVVVAGIFDGATNIGAPLPVSPGKAAAVWGAAHTEEPLPEDGKLLENLDIVMTMPVDERPAIRPFDDERVLDVIARNRRLENDLHHGGQPSLKGSDDAAMSDGIQERSLDVKNGDAIFLFTDGGYPGPLHTPQQQQEVIDVLRKGGIQGLRAWVYQKEDDDPSLHNPPRMKQYDDLVAMSVRVRVD